MASKKKSQGVLKRIGDMASSAAEVVIDAGSKAMHAVGDMMPSGTPEKGAKASSKASKSKSPKVSAKSTKAPPKATAKTSQPQKKVDAKTRTAASKKASPTKSAKTAAKVWPSPKHKRPAAKNI